MTRTGRWELFASPPSHSSHCPHPCNTSPGRRVVVGAARDGVSDLQPVSTAHFHVSVQRKSHLCLAGLGCWGVKETGQGAAKPARRPRAPWKRSSGRSGCGLPFPVLYSEYPRLLRDRCASGAGKKGSTQLPGEMGRSDRKADVILCDMSPSNVCTILTGSILPFSAVLPAHVSTFPGRSLI